MTRMSSFSGEEGLARPFRLQAVHINKAGTPSAHTVVNQKETPLCHGRYRLTGNPEPRNPIRFMNHEKK